MKKEKKENAQLQGDGAKKRTAVLYTRVEKRETTDPSKALDAQERELRKFCEEEGIEVVKVYYDVASGHTFNRTEFKKLLNDVVSKKVKADFLLFTDITVFCTDIEELLTMHFALEGAGITPKAIKPVNVVHVIMIHRVNINDDKKDKK